VVGTVVLAARTVVYDSKSESNLSAKLIVLLWLRVMAEVVAMRATMANFICFVCLLFLILTMIKNKFLKYSQK